MFPQSYGQLLDPLRSSGSSIQRDPRLMTAHLHAKSHQLLFIHIWRIRDDQVKSLIDLREPVALDEVDPVGHLVALRVLLGERERNVGDVDRCDVCQRMKLGQADRDDAGTGSQVETSNCLVARERGECFLNQFLSLRTRNQRFPRHTETQTQKGDLPGEVLQWNAVPPLLDRLAITQAFLGGERLLRIQVQVKAIYAQYGGEQDLRLQPGLDDPRVTKVASRPLEDLAYGPVAAQRSPPSVSFTPRPPKRAILPYTIAESCIEVKHCIQ